jgi:choline dehydrogenase-like flavoprotein
VFADARGVPGGSLITADVCIVGAGAAGITIARELRTRRLRVVVLESGGFAPDEVTQRLYAGEVRERPYFALEAERTRTRCFGGSTHRWAGECRPLDSLDFEPREWVPDSGWPFGLAHLLPFYDRAQTVCQLGPFAYAGADWSARGADLIPFHGERVLSRALHYSPPTRFGEVYRDEIGQAGTVVAYLGANVVDLETPTPPDRVKTVRVACLSGSTFRVQARAFVLCAGGVENARLLLMSNSVQPAGLGNAHDQVGRYFMEHLYLDRAATILARGASVGDFYTSGRCWAGRRVRGVLALGPEVQRRERLTNFCAFIVEEEPREALAWCWSLLAALRRRPGRPGALAQLRNAVAFVGTAAAARARAAGSGRRGERRPMRLYALKQAMEQAPNPGSRIVLGQERDQLGCPRVALHWRLTAVDKRSAHRAHEILGEELTRAGAGRFRSSLGREVDPWPSELRGARHHMGTTRMHPDPRRGVVDADCRVHGIANLYVAGSSVFPTSGTANPTLTIVALALRLADHLIRLFG